MVTAQEIEGKRGSFRIRLYEILIISSVVKYSPGFLVSYHIQASWNLSVCSKNNTPYFSFNTIFPNLLLNNVEDKKEMENYNFLNISFVIQTLKHTICQKVISELDMIFHFFKIMFFNFSCQNVLDLDYISIQICSLITCRIS